MKKIVAVFMVLGMVGCSSTSTTPSTTIACSYSDDSQGFLMNENPVAVVDAEDQLVSLKIETQLSTWAEGSEIGYTEYSEALKTLNMEEMPEEYAGYTVEETYDDENQIIDIVLEVDYATLAEEAIEALELPTTGSEIKELVEASGHVCE
ncbi:MAG: hypothetical protein ACK5LZ_01285 [Anaerorhabdus sp.]